MASADLDLLWRPRAGIKGAPLHLVRESDINGENGREDITHSVWEACIYCMPDTPYTFGCMR